MEGCLIAETELYEHMEKLVDAIQPQEKSQDSVIHNLPILNKRRTVSTPQ